MPRLGTMDHVVALEMSSTASGSGGGPAGKPRRGCVSLGRLFRQLDYGSITAAAAVCIALLIWQAILGGPRERPFLVSDATIAYPHMCVLGAAWPAAGRCLPLLLAHACSKQGRLSTAHNHTCPACLPRRGSSVPYWLAVVVCTLAMAASVLLAELWLARHADATDAAAAVVHFLLDAICAFFVCGLTTEARVQSLA